MVGGCKKHSPKSLIARMRQFSWGRQARRLHCRKLKLTQQWGMSNSSLWAKSQSSVMYCWVDMRLSKWLKLVVFRQKAACVGNQKYNCRASNWFSPLEPTTVNTHSEFQLDASSSCRDTGVGKWCLANLVNFRALGKNSIKTDWYTLFRCGFRPKA